MRHFKIFCLLASALVGGMGTMENAQAAAASDYKIQPEDFLKISVLGESELDMETRVEASGIIFYWLLGQVQVGGKTAGEVKKHITELLDEKYLVNPQVHVIVLSYKEQTFSVMGEVKISGVYPILPGKKFTIIEVIAKAGGFTPEAKKSKIQLFRNGKVQAFKHSDLLMLDPKKQKPILIQPDDVIVVGESFF